MGQWSIQIPFRSREDSLSPLGELGNRLEADEDAAVARQLVISGVMAGLPTAGELVDRVERLDAAGRRELLDAARCLAGLKSASEIEFQEQHKRRQLAASIKAVNDPRPMRVAYTETGALVDLNEREDERAERERITADDRRGSEAQARHVARSMRLPRSEPR